MNLIESCKEIQKEVLDNWMNYQDLTKGIYWVCEIDGMVIEHLEADIDIKVINYQKNYMELEIYGKYQIFIKLSENDIEYEWIIEYAKEIN